MRSLEALKDSLQKRNKKSYKITKKVIITDLIILAHKRRCTRDGTDCQREHTQKKKKGAGCGVLYSSCLCHARRIPPLCRLRPNPCNLLVLRRLHHSHTSQLQCSRKTKTPGCKHLCETNASSSKRFPPIALLMASAPRQHYFFIQSRKCTVSKQSMSFTVLFHSDQSCLFPPSPLPMHTTEYFSCLSRRLRSQNLDWSNILNALLTSTN